MLVIALFTLLEDGHEVVEGLARKAQRVLYIEAALFPVAHSYLPSSVRIQQVVHL